MSIDAIAAALREARACRVAIAPLSETAGIEDPAVAYEIQAINTAWYEGAGRQVVGCKIGLTSEAVQQQLGVDEPDFGVLWGDEAYGDGDEISVGQYLQPRVEAEVAFVLARDLADPAVTMTQLAESIECARSAIEIVDSAIADWRIKLADTIADNASAAAFVLGSDACRIDEVDLHSASMSMTCNGREVSSGVTAACMGNPLNATLWLVKKMIQVGRPLKAGDIILSGALGPMVDVHAGDDIRVDIQGFQPFGVRFVA